jgi:hypothetical protein
VAADYVGLMQYGEGLQQAIAQNTDPDVARYLAELRNQNNNQLAQAGGIVVINLSELDQNKGGLGAVERGLLASLNAQSNGQSVTAVFGTGLVGADRIGRLTSPGGRAGEPPAAPPVRPVVTGDEDLPNVYDTQRQVVDKAPLQATDASAGSAYNSTARPYGETTVRGANGNAVPSGTTAESALNGMASKNVDKVDAPIDFDHIIGADYRRNADGSIKVVGGQSQPTGGHSLVNGDVKIVPGTETAPDASGVYQARVQMPDPNNPGAWLDKPGSTHTMFPKEWTADRIKVEVDAAWSNRTVSGNQWEGYTPSGVLVRGYVSPRTTAYPVPTTPNPPAGGKP